MVGGEMALQIETPGKAQVAAGTFVNVVVVVLGLIVVEQKQLMLKRAVTRPAHIWFGTMHGVQMTTKLGVRIKVLETVATMLESVDVSKNPMSDAFLLMSETEIT